MDVLSYLAGDEDLEKSPVWEKRSPKLLLDGLQDIFTRPWFQRMWVVQETAALSRRAVMVCGKHEFAWTYGLGTRRLLRRMKFAAISPKWEQAGLTVVNMSSLIQVLEMGVNTLREQPSDDLLDVVYYFRHRQSTDPRDKIFALVGLAYLRGIRFRVDYTQSMEEISKRLLDECRESLT